MAKLLPTVCWNIEKHNRLKTVFLFLKGEWDVWKVVSIGCWNMLQYLCKWPMTVPRTEGRALTGLSSVSYRAVCMDGRLVNLPFQTWSHVGCVTLQLVSFTAGHRRPCFCGDGSHTALHSALRELNFLFCFPSVCCLIFKRSFSRFVLHPQALFMILPSQLALNILGN